MSRRSRYLLAIGLGMAASCMAQDERLDSSPLSMSDAPVPGGSLEYQSSGAGETVLLIHGAVTAAAFLPLVDEPALADYRLVRYHRRGFAGSMDHTGPSSLEQQAGDAIALLDHLGVERAHIVGHSLGGMIALQVALQAPERVGALVLLEAGPLPLTESGPGEPSQSNGSGTPPPLPPEEPPFLAPYLAGDTETAARTFMRFVGGENWREHLDRAGAEAWEQVIEDFHLLIETEMVMPILPAAAFEELAVPTLYVLGSETQLGPVTADMLEQSAMQLLPDVEIRRLQDMNHSMQLKDPATIASLIEAFLARHTLLE